MTRSGIVLLETVKRAKDTSNCYANTAQCYTEAKRIAHGDIVLARRAYNCCDKVSTACDLFFIAEDGTLYDIGNGETPPVKCEHCGGEIEQDPILCDGKIICGGGATLDGEHEPADECYEDESKITENDKRLLAKLVAKLGKERVQAEAERAALGSK